MQQAQSNISSCFDSWSSIKGCYRFFSNNKVDKNVIIQENSTISRIEESTGKIFIAHDTTYIDYKKHKKNGTLDRIFSSGKEKEGNLGLILHNSLALTASGIPLGVINQKFVRRKTIKHPARKISSKHFCHTRPIIEKESYKWIEAINNIHDLKILNKDVIHIVDRESDIYELYRNCNQRQIQFVVRGKENRAINKKKKRKTKISPF
ncbi:MAG: hypothetical protein H6743_01885 [Rickettsiaceae bacterium]|nr:hypothetical protein [Rickettsiaceae bacterium]